VNSDAGVLSMQQRGLGGFERLCCLYIVQDAGVHIASVCKYFYSYVHLAAQRSK
jgi:hypothetical protein